MLATSLPVAQWLERPTGVRKVMGSIPVGDSEFFFVPRLRHVDYSIFSSQIVIIEHQRQSFLGGSVGMPPRNFTF